MVVVVCVVESNLADYPTVVVVVVVDGMYLPFNGVFARPSRPVWPPLNNRRP